VQRQQKIGVSNTHSCVFCPLFDDADSDIGRDLIGCDLKPHEIEGVEIGPQRALIGDSRFRVVMPDRKVALLERDLKIVTEQFAPVFLEDP
jgi:hypothetical protein